MSLTTGFAFSPASRQVDVTLIHATSVALEDGKVPEWCARKPASGRETACANSKPGGPTGSAVKKAERSHDRTWRCMRPPAPTWS